MTAREIIEVEDPKDVFRNVTRPVWIGAGLWIMTSKAGTKHQLGHVFYYGSGDQKYHMRDVLGEPNSVTCAQAFDTEEEAKAALLELVKRKGLVRTEPRTMRWELNPDGTHRQYYEAEDPKAFLRQASADRHDADFQELLRKMELEEVPWPDSFERGQRVRRLALNPFGANPFGGEPNGIGDLGTVKRFLARRDEPQHSLYLVNWDRAPFSCDYMTHDQLEPVEGEALRVLDAMVEAEDPKEVFKKLKRHAAMGEQATVRCPNCGRERTLLRNWPKAWDNVRDWGSDCVCGEWLPYADYWAVEP